MFRPSRRQILLGGAAGASASLLPPSLHRALAHPARPGGLNAIEHVVVLMQENRSFDQYFGTLRGVRGFSDPHAIRLPDGGSVFEQRTPEGKVVAPFLSRKAARASGKADTAVQYVGTLDHDWAGGHAAWSRGWLDQWISAKTESTMAYYDRRDIAFHSELADVFTVCDAYHCSVQGATNPNRMYLMTGTVGYEPGSNVRRAISNDAYDEENHAGYDWTTYPERLQRAGVSWQVYQEWDNFTDNALEFFARFKAIARKALSKTVSYRTMTAFYEAVQKAPNEHTRETLLSQLEQGVATLGRQERSLFERALRRHPSGKLLDRFESDVARGRLPKVSYIVTNAADSEHPSVSSPAAGAQFIYRLLDILASRPDVWSRTVFLLTYDENDGFFDHVPPPVPEESSAEQPTPGPEIYDRLPIGLGFRVPTIVISPWSVGGYVCSEVFDHTSVLRFLEKWTGIVEPNISEWRRTVCGDLLSCFDFETSAPRPPVRAPEPIPPAVPRWHPAPPAVAEIPQQEPGQRPARPLPYQPEARCEVDAENRRLTIHLRNRGTESAHFIIYPYAAATEWPLHVDVRVGKTRIFPITGNDYDLVVVGPAGFRREFRGRIP
ncbi:phospholipase C, phosphocholine-specific [Pendulispora rubella]|uniref:phospholipase C n=1 Tax=Pendulispora rubella TaxID=2741070 RepID=A0ABZ2L8U6_9BACT